MTLETLALAPMQGIVNDLLRDLYGEVGGLDYCVTEFIRVTHHPLSERTLLDSCPELVRGCRTSNGIPVHLQLLGGQPEPMAKTAALAASLGAQVIDLNFGCPVRRVNRHDGGAALLREPSRIRTIAEAVRSAVPDQVMVSAKIRLGWDDPADVIGLAQAVESAGASLLTIHGRTRVQAYSGRADWSWIGRARQAVAIPVVANGDITTPDELSQCAGVTGCSRFMVGRGAVARPEVFRVLRGLDTWWPPFRRVELLRKLLDRCEERSPGHGGFALGRVKGWCALMAGADDEIAGVFLSIKRVGAVAEVRRLLDDAIARGRDKAHSAEDTTKLATK